MSKLTERDHDNIDLFLCSVLDSYKKGVIDQSKALASITNLIGYIDEGNIPEVGDWLESANSAK